MEVEVEVEAEVEVEEDQGKQKVGRDREGHVGRGARLMARHGYLPHKIVSH